MAAGGADHRRHSKGRHQRLLFVVEENRIHDHGCYTNLVIRINLKEMFTHPGVDEEKEDWTTAMRSLPCPMAVLRAAGSLPERLNLAVVSDTTTNDDSTTSIVAVSFGRDTVIYDVAAAAEVPCGSELRHAMTGGPALIPLGTRLYAIPFLMWPPCADYQPNFQALLLPPAAPAARRRGGVAGGNRGRWSWRALPAPPAEMWERRKKTPFCTVTAFLAAGTRVWVSASGRGTYSFDTARLAWRKDGDWELPFQGRGLVVPDLGLCFGLCPRRFCLCAFDLPTAGGQPPAARYVWQDTYAYECVASKFCTMTPGNLAYLGDGKFCITWTIAIGYDQNQNGACSRFALLLIAVQVVRCSPPHDGQELPAAGEAAGAEELRLVKHKVRCYKDVGPRN